LPVLLGLSMGEPGVAVNPGALWHIGNELRDVLPLNTLTEADGLELVSRMRARRLVAGEVLYHRHDQAADAFVVHQGLVKLVLQNWDGRELLIDLCGRGEFVGTLTLFDPDARRESTVVAAMPTTVLQVPREDAARVLLRNPEAIQFMLRRYTRMTQRLQRQIEATVSLDAASRLALFLIELEHLPDPVRLTQDELAAGIGVSLRTVQRILADFAKRGIAAVEPQAVRILDEKRLRQVIQSWVPSEVREEFFRDLEGFLARRA
jgi:CRP-like cAMP-binding protein